MSETDYSGGNVLDVLREQFGRVNARLDRIETGMRVRLDTMLSRIDRVERRLELVG